MFQVVQQWVSPVGEANNSVAVQSMCLHVSDGPIWSWRPGILGELLEHIGRLKKPVLILVKICYNGRLGELTSEIVRKQAARQRKHPSPMSFYLDFHVLLSITRRSFHMQAGSFHFTQPNQKHPSCECPAASLVDSRSTQLDKTITGPKLVVQ